MYRAIAAGFVVTMMSSAQPFTRGVGVYPGDPEEYAGPVLHADTTTYRNLALHRPAYHSSSYDYNLTAQLVTDGIKDTKMPRWVATSTSQHGELKKNQREWPLDRNWVSTVDLKGTDAWIQVELGGGSEPLTVDRVEVDGRVIAPPGPENFNIAVLASDDGKTWKQVANIAEMTRSGGDFRSTAMLAGPSQSRFYRLQITDPRARGFQVGEIRFTNREQPVRVGGPYDFTSAWMPAGSGEEWVYVDLGASCTFDRVALSWIRRASQTSIEVSDDAKTWRTLQGVAAGTDDVKLAQPGQGRYVRVRAFGNEYVLSEMEVFGRGGPVPEAQSGRAPMADGRLHLSRGGWRIQRSSAVTADGPALSRAGYVDRDWLVATVPGSVLASYQNAGAIPDQNFGDNQLMISDSFFYSDFWYRDEFVAPAVAPGRHAWLHFDGVNWKADVFLNGQKLGRIEGGFLRSRFDVTRLLQPGKKNAVAVRVERNENPGSVKEKTFESPDKNGGVLGADNPTYHATIGWDWIPTMRGRDTGIWNNVYLAQSGPVSVADPFVETSLPLPDTSRAEIALSATLRNHEARPVSGTLRASFGDLKFQKQVTVPASVELAVKFDPQTLAQAKLWWPAGYGDPNLYPVALRFETGNAQLSDSTEFQAGVRQFTYSEDGGSLRMWINGRRFVPRGGNWGFSEAMLRYRAREYDAAVRYHRDMNFTMIRNWVGQIGEDAFYDACDRHGIVVWQDFWLANPWDGPDPNNNAMFERNVNDTIRRIRNHASIGLYCGRNEGYPPKPLDDAIRAAIKELHPGLHYISSSADDVVSGHGPYQAMPLEYYFRERATAKFHSEMGMPNIVTMDSIRAMMPEEAMWPLGRVWGLHDFCLTGAQGGASFIERIRKSYGGAENIADWVKLSQFVNYEGYRAMFESQSKYRMGMLIWMSHPAWPSFVWQTYDYYLDPSAAYFGSKKGSEPLHIQWNPVAEAVEVVNYSGGDAKGLTAQAVVLNADGSVRWQKSAALDSAEDTTSVPIKMEYPAGVSSVHFIRLQLMRGGSVLSENFYWRGTEPGDYRGLREIPNATVAVDTKANLDGNHWLLTTELHNASGSPALMLRVKAIREKSGDRILPALYSDNYVSLMPGERKTITTSLAQADARDERPRVVLEGFNLKDTR